MVDFDEIRFLACGDDFFEATDSTDDDEEDADKDVDGKLDENEMFKAASEDFVFEIRLFINSFRFFSCFSSVGSVT